MDDNRDQPNPQPPMRHFVYRSAMPDTTGSHPLRRATDMPHPFQPIPGQISTRTELLKFRVYLKIN